MINAILSANRLIAGYVPHVDILNGVSITVADNEIVSVIGPNGAGKSTLLKALTGMIVPRSGQIILDAVDLTGLQPHAIVRRGLGYVPQRNNVFEGLTVEENLEIGLKPRRDLPLRARIDATYELFPWFADRRRQHAGSLSGGARQLLAMARAMMPQPRVLLLDEPSAGLAPRFVDFVFEQIAAMNRAGVAILMVEQNVRRALAVSHRGYVLNLGCIEHEGTSMVLGEDPRINPLNFAGWCT